MTARRLFARTPKTTVRITTFHPNAIRHNVCTTTQPGNSRSLATLPVLIACAIAMPLVWFVIGPAWVRVIDYLVSLAP